MKKILSLLLAVILAFGGVVGLMLAHPQPVKAATSYYVNDDSTTGDAYCTAVGDDANNGTSAATPKRTIQAIINGYDLGAGDTVYVDTGTYVENIIISGADDGAHFLGAGAALSTIDGNNTSTVIYTTFLTGATTLEGFTITNGGAVGYGAGMENNSSSPTITNCTFSGNSVLHSGGGMYNDSCSPTITNCTFSGNSAVCNGAGMWNDDNSSPTITNCTFSGNSAGDLGGGMYNEISSSPTITNCTFSGNSAGSFGGGMFNHDSSSPTITNCTFSGNSADSLGGGLGNVNDSTPTVTNCIFWGDAASNYSEIFDEGYSSTITYCDVQGGYAGTGNIGVDPLFVDAGGGDFHLQSEAGHWTSTIWVTDSQTSPCIDAGDGSAFANEPVPNGGCINMGAYGNTSQASKSAPEINLKEGVTDIANGGSYDFGSQLTGTNTDVTFTIENTGTVVLTLTTPLTITGINADQFSIPIQPTSPVAASGSTTFVVRFTPTSVDAKTASISIANNDGDENPYDLTIQGTGTAPEMNLKEGVTDIVDGGSYDFGSQLTGTDTDVTFTIENTGTGGLTLTTPITIGGVNADQFSIQTQPISPVAASGSTTFTVRFTPTSEGDKTATISIANNDGDENPYDLTITGTGFIPEEPDHYLRMDLLGTRQRVTTSSSGRLRRTIEVTSANGKLTVTIPSGTRAKQENGNRLTTLSVIKNDNPPPPPENKYIIGLPYSFEPSGATFDPSITLTFHYEHADIPSGVNEEDLVLAFYDEDTGEWIECMCTCDPDTNCIIACIFHFTDFAIIAPVPTPAPTTPQPEPAPTTPQPEPAPAAFSLSGLSVLPAEVELGETITVSMVVTNTGGEVGSYTAVLKINGVKEEEKTVTIAAGSSQTVSFRVTEEEAESYTITVDGLSGSFTVVTPPAPAAFSLSGLSVLPAEVELGETITVSMVVANTGGEAGSYTAVLKINGVKEEEKTVTIAAGSSQTISFSVTREEAESYTVTVGGLSGSFTVVVQPTPTAESTPAVEEGGINWYIIGAILGVVLLLGIFLPIWIRRRKEG